MVNRFRVLLYGCTAFLLALSSCQRPASIAPIQTVTKHYDFPIPIPVQNLQFPSLSLSPTVNSSYSLAPTNSVLPFPTPSSLREDYSSKVLMITLTPSPTVIITPQGTNVPSRKILTPRATWVFQDPTPTLTIIATEKPPSSIPVTKVPTSTPTIISFPVTPSVPPSISPSSTPKPTAINTQEPDPTEPNPLPSETSEPVETPKPGKPPTNTPKPKDN